MELGERGRERGGGVNERREAGWTEGSREEEEERGQLRGERRREERKAEGEEEGKRENEVDTGDVTLLNLQPAPVFEPH